MKTLPDKTLAKPLVFAVDIDGVICRTYPPLLDLFGEMFGIDCRNDGLVHYDFEKCFPVTSRQVDAALLELIHSRPHLLQPYGFAANGLRKLRTMGQVWLVTARLTCNYEPTVAWLAEHGFDYDLLIFTRHKLAVAPHVACIIEDKLETALGFANAGVTAYLKDEPYNECGPVPGVHRFTDWPLLSDQMLHIYAERD